MGDCKQCQILEDVIDELSEQLSKSQRRRRELSRTIRMMRDHIVDMMVVEQELQKQGLNRMLEDE